MDRYKIIASTIVIVLVALLTWIIVLRAQQLASQDAIQDTSRAAAVRSLNDQIKGLR